ncbi:hypothetical protein [Opitutus terrae]|uniref:hypothetical protein n=1 Tax=Opitutus terrae TaxID=107709 RepID=UPI001ED8F281|nr:hypothetical protein [Opitutus terrae]
MQEAAKKLTPEQLEIVVRVAVAAREDGLSILDAQAKGLREAIGFKLPQPDAN